MVDITVTKINEAKIRIATNPNINAELAGYYSARPEGYYFMPQYQAGVWDGYSRFYSYNTLRIGLLDDLKDFAAKGGYSLDIQFDDRLEVDFQEFEKFVAMLKIPMEVRDYQMKAAHSIICNKRELTELPTGSGKSLVIYLVVRFLLLNSFKILIIVPKINLVEQLYGDFIEYGWGWENLGNFVHRVYGGKDKTIEKPVTITTWQSMYKGTKIFEQFDAFIIDESHHAKAKSITHMTDSCINAQWRIGTSGTYPKKKSADWFSTVGAVGGIKQYATFKELKEKGFLADLEINNLLLGHTNELRERNFLLNQGNWTDEVGFINEIEKRNNFIVRIALSQKRNTFILFTRIKHGKVLFEKIQGCGKRVYYIDGSTKVDKREEIRHTLESSENVILVASFGTFAEGVNVKNVHNIIFASNYKSKIKVLQAIGRGLRKMVNKDKVVIYDLIDDLTWEYQAGRDRLKRTYRNLTLKHYGEREKIYKEQGFDIIHNHSIRLR